MPLTTPGQNLLGAPETGSFLCPTGFLPRKGGASTLLPCLINPSLYVMPINAALLTDYSGQNLRRSIKNQKGGALLYIYRVYRSAY